MKTTTSLTEPLALFGGTFDPVHYGHLKCADEARSKLGLEKLTLVPAGHPPHRGTPLATTRQRLEMLQLALTEFPNLALDTRETRRQGPSYMVDTLAEIRAESPARPLILLLGQDAANLLHTWFEWQRLFSVAHLVILTRPDSLVDYPNELAVELTPRLTSDALELLSSECGKILQLEVESIDVSATRIKQLLRQGGSPAAMLPAVVLEYIQHNHLYAKSHDS